MKCINLYKSHFEPVALRGRSKFTKDSYIHLFRTWKKYSGGYEMRVEDCANGRMLEFLEWAQQGRKNTTINFLARLINCWSKYLVEEGHIERRDHIRMLPETHLVPEAYTVEEIQRILRKARKCLNIWYPKTVKPIPYALWMTCAIRTIWDTGERINALKTMPWDCVDLATGVIEIPAIVRKQTRPLKAKLKPRTLTEMRILYCYHTEWRRGNPTWNPDRHVFYIQRNRGSIAGDLGEIIKSCKIKVRTGERWNRFRRSYASYLEAAGFSATVAMMHKNRSTTERYLDPRIVTHESPNEHLPDLK